MMPYRLLLHFTLALLTLSAAFSAGAEAAGRNDEVLFVGHFSETDAVAGIPPDWEPMTFEKIEAHTTYQLVDDHGITVIRAESRSSASGLIRKIRIDPQKYPVIEWRWKATGVYEKGDASKKSGDDYPARIYIAFEYDPERVGFFERAKFESIKLLRGEYPPIGAISYIWASNAPAGTMTENPYTDRVMMIAVESGNNRLNTWVSESRNIVDDYKAAFGEAPPMIRGIAIMTDSDNTGESAVTYYGDIVMKSSP